MSRSNLLFKKNNQPTRKFAEFLSVMGIPGDDLTGIDEALQRRFFQKDAHGKPLERWKLRELKNVESSIQLNELLATCGFLSATSPKKNTYARAAWPGALVTRAAAWLHDLVHAWESGVHWEETIVFAGKRPLHPEKETYAKCLEALGLEDDAKRRRLWKELNPETELDMMRFLWLASGLPTELGLGVRFVDTPLKPPREPGGPPVRPNTEDTIQEWLKSQPAPGSILVSSGAPYGMAQNEAFAMLLEPHGHTVETFGHAAPDLPMENFMREIARCVHRIRRSRGV